MIIKTENIVKIFKVGDSVVKALDGVSFNVDEGDMVAVTGTSGSGKTTLLNIIGCLGKPDSGKYFLTDVDVSNLSKDQLAETRNRRIGFVFQSFNLISRMSSLENVELPLLYAGADDAKSRAVESLKSVRLFERMNHEPNQLSGGESQRVSIARALVTKPSILLADEPTGNLDSKTSGEILELFAKLNNEGLTVLIVTHDDDVAARCKRVIRMMDGKIISDKRNGRVSRE
ncbi:ABC transporter ATP-binding protein [bacterium]|nr:ABC transporter ATP-binding protein [bacterium]